MVAHALDNQPPLDRRQGNASFGSLRSSLDDWDNAIYLQPNAQVGGALDEARALACRSDLPASALTLGDRDGRSAQSDENQTGDAETARSIHRRSSEATGRRYAFKEV
jgi:hypothetical protein